MNTKEFLEYWAAHPGQDDGKALYDKYQRAQAAGTEAGGRRSVYHPRKWPEGLASRV